VNRKWKFYRAVHTGITTRKAMTDSLAWTAATGAKESSEIAVMAKKTNFVELGRWALLESYAPASVVTDVKGNVLHVHGDTGKYLRVPPGQHTTSLPDMAREGLHVALRAALHAASHGEAVLGKEVSVKTNGDVHPISLSVRPLPDPDGGPGFLLTSFQDITPARATKRSRRRTGDAAVTGRTAELERELAYTRESLQAIIEEQQAATEELKSTNEELQSTNEELQSTNEELETSKEELQSVNEELITVNSELEAKIEQLTDVQNDLKNLLDNINIGTIFLDQRLSIRRFTRDMTRVYRLVATDVGRPLADIKSNLADDDLTERAESVLASLVPYEQEVRTADGSAYLARIQPYRTLDNIIDGVVLTFTDISKRVKAETAERNARQLAEGIIDTLREPLVVLDDAMTVISASRAFYRHFGVASDTVVGKRLYDLGDRQWDIPALHELLESILPQRRSFDGFAVEHSFPGVGLRKVVLNARQVLVAVGEAPLILLAIEFPEEKSPEICVTPDNKPI